MIQLQNSWIQQTENLERHVNLFSSLREWAFEDIESRPRWESLDIDDRIKILMVSDNLHSKIMQANLGFKERYTFRSNSKKSEIRKKFVTGLPMFICITLVAKHLKEAQKKLLKGEKTHSLNS
jgi:hypothetical protein